MAQVVNPDSAKNMGEGGIIDGIGNLSNPLDKKKEMHYLASLPLKKVYRIKITSINTK